MLYSGAKGTMRPNNRLQRTAQPRRRRTGALSAWPHRNSLAKSGPLASCSYLQRRKSNAALSIEVQLHA